MKIHTRGRRLCACLICLVLICTLLPASAQAHGLIDPGKRASLTIEYPCKGIAFELYRVADVSAYGAYTLDGDFQAYSVSLEQPDQAGWQALATALDGYVTRDALKPLVSGATDADGRLTFSELETGLYLVTWKRHTTGGYTYTPKPFLVSLPGLNAEDDWIYDVTAVPKYDRKSSGGGGGSDTIRRKVLKVWEDSGAPSKRPEEITVQLLRDGMVWDTVTLNEKNNWSYEWSRLSDDYSWKVTEADVPEGYTVKVSQEGITFVVTNTYTPDEPDNPDQPGNPDEPDHPDTPNPPGQPSVNHPDESPNPPGRPVSGEPETKLPQTGVLWWPVPLLACGGVGLFLIGWAQRRSEEHHEE